jgi:hypothetical protein
MVEKEKNVEHKLIGPLAMEIAFSPLIPSLPHPKITLFSDYEKYGMILNMSITVLSNISSII